MKGTKGTIRGHLPVFPALPKLYPDPPGLEKGEFDAEVVAPKGAALQPGEVVDVPFSAKIPPAPNGDEVVDVPFSANIPPASNGDEVLGCQNDGLGVPNPETALAYLPKPEVFSADGAPNALDGVFVGLLLEEVLDSVVPPLPLLSCETLAWLEGGPLDDGSAGSAGAEAGVTIECPLGVFLDGIGVAAEVFKLSPPLTTSGDLASPKLSEPSLGGIARVLVLEGRFLCTDVLDGVANAASGVLVIDTFEIIGVAVVEISR